eukprot:TRINITY_DN11742_c0_g1_i1.p3 TRINITY_DN11742_c0_g1~~TRINITY_DN11742_c0_g1_i1.p3  ORF type:complete len:110 (+),score=8.26 TRINITY_DN11742_c0_g1_i1:375-704(+)
MVNDMLSIVIDPYFPPSQEFLNQQKEQQNLFVLLHSDIINRAGITKKLPQNFFYPIEQCAQPQNNQRTPQVQPTELSVIIINTLLFNLRITITLIILSLANQKLTCFFN